MRVAAFPTACANLLPRAAAVWRRRHPGPPFAFTECDADQAVDLARQGTADLAVTYDYAAHPIDLRAICGAAGFTPRVALHSNRYPTTLAMVAAGHGIALVPSIALAQPPAGVAIRPLRPVPPPRRLWTVTHGRPSAAVADLVDSLVAAAGAHTPSGALTRTPG